MDLKLILLSVACFGLFIQPAQSGSIGFAVFDTVRDIAAIGTNAFKTKVGAVVRGGTDIGSILATGVGLKIAALAKASGTIGEAATNGFIDAGKRIDKMGDDIVGDIVGTSDSENTRILVAAPVVQEVIEKVKVNTPTVVEQEVATGFMSRSGNARYLVASPVVQEVIEKVKVDAPTVVEQEVAKGFVSRSGNTRVLLAAPVVQEVIEKVKVNTPTVVEQEVGNGFIRSGNARVLVAAPAVQEVIENVKVDTPTVVEQVVAEPCGEEEIVAVPSSIQESISSVQLKVREPETIVETARIPVIVNRPSVWNMLENAALARSRASEFEEVVNFGGIREGPFVYNMFDTPQFESFMLRK